MERCLSEKLTGPQIVKQFPKLMEPEGSFPHSQAPVTCRHLETEQSGPFLRIPLLEKININIIPPMFNGKRCYEDMEHLKYLFVFWKMWNRGRKGYMKSVLSVGFIAVTHIYDMPTGSVLYLVTKLCDGTHLPICAITLSRQSLSLKFGLPGRVMNKLLI